MNEPYVVVKAGLLSKGLIEEVADGNYLTDKGWDVARNKWLLLSEEDRLLFTLLVCRLTKRVLK